MSYSSDPKKIWRKVVISADMEAPLEELARVSGPVYVKPIVGFGSYQDGTTASGNIALRGGHIDLDLTGMTESEALKMEADARKIGFYADIRYVKQWFPKENRWRVFSWQKHLHMVLKDSIYLSDLAKAQVYQWQVNATDGIVGPDGDNGPRNYVWQTFSQYLKNAFGAATGIGTTVVVAGLQKAVYEKADGWWGDISDISLGNTRAQARDARYFQDKRWTKAQRVEMQRTWGTTQDGIWGPNTAAAAVATVKRMQTAMGVTPDGVWGPTGETEKAFRDLRGRAYKGTRGLPGFYSTTTLQPMNPPVKKPAVVKPPIKPVVKVDTRTFGVAISDPIRLANLKKGSRNMDVAQYQMGLWNGHGASYREAICKKYGLTRAQFADGVYGKVTAEATTALYRALYGKDKKFWSTPTADEPGKRLLEYLKFTRIS